MDSKAISPASPVPLNAMLHNATIDKAEGNEFNNTARDMFKFVLNYNQNGRSAVPTGAGQAIGIPVSEFHDAINYFLNAVPLFVEEVRKNDQSRSTVAETTGNDSSDPVPQSVTTDHTLEGNQVDILDLVPSEPSSLPVASVADRYTRSMLKCLAGYPLYEPQPFSELSREYVRHGVNVGDVGFVRGNGVFDFLFNICPSKEVSINPSNLPDSFSLDLADHSTTRGHLPKTCLLQSPITRTKSGEYICEGSEGREGAILELPEGAIQDEATNIRPFAKLAARHGVQWYEYTLTRGREISNGSLYLITSVTKCSQWGIAVFDRPCAPGQGLRFDKKRSLPFSKSTSKYHWKGSHAFPTKVSNLNQGDSPNQCVFLRGYKIMIRQDIFDNLYNDQPCRSNSTIPSSSPPSGSSNITRQRATRIRGGGGPDPVSRLTDAGLLSQPISTVTSDEEVVLHPNFNSSIVHPSDLINAALLSQNPGAKVALSHDNVWCNLLRDSFPKLNYAILINVARLYTHTIEHDCVSLEKISDPSNVPEESSRLLQGTGATALQGQLTTTCDDYTPIPATTSLILPHELVERIILLLDTKSMVKCRLINRNFNAIIQSSTSVQYYLACNTAGVVDNPRSPLSYSERLEALKRREDAWMKLKPVFEMTIKRPMSPVYELTAGNYFTGVVKDLYYCHLPSSPDDIPQWNKIPALGPGQSLSGVIDGMGMAVYEHDLIVNVISSRVGNQAGMLPFSIDLVLLKFSTGEYHPLARHPLIHIQRSSSPSPYHAIIRIVGDNVALVIYGHAGSELFIFDWKTGHKRLATGDAYTNSVPVFVSPQLLLVPNRKLSHFEVWHLFPSHPNPKPPMQILSLKFPAVSGNCSISFIHCHGELSPFLQSMPYFPLRPFFPSPENSIITITFLLLAPNSLKYQLILHRSALLDVIQKWTLPSLLEQQGLPKWLLNEVTDHKVPDPDDGSVRFMAQSKVVSIMSNAMSPRNSSDSLTLATSPTSPTSGLSADSSSSSTSSSSCTSRYNILQVQWADWGPPIGRWFQLNASRSTSWWIPQSTGQRCAFLDPRFPNPRDKRVCVVSVADFNLHNVRENAEMLAQLTRVEGEDTGNNGKGKTKDEDELELLDDQEGGFSEDVYMGLKCVVYHLPGEYDFDGVMMDEERLLGFKFNGQGFDASTKVLYFG